MTLPDRPLRGNPEAASERGLDELVQVPTSLYEHGYDTLERFQSYWHQLHEASRLGGRLVEIGVGNGAVSSVLRSRGLEVVTVDIDRDLGPDVVADVRSLPFEDGSFDGVLACEVLEHVPWTDLPKALGEFQRVARRWAVVSIPSVGPAAALQAWLPNALHVGRMMLRGRWAIRDGLWALSQPVVWRRAGGTVSRVGTIDPVRERPHVFNGEHYWVLGEGGLVADDFSRLVQGCGFAIVRDFRPAGAVSHHFFVLEPASDRTS
jgi:SAM-dependent methyltransferase